MKLFNFLMAIAIFLGIIVLVLFIITANADAHFKPGTHNAVHAIQLVFCGKSNRHCYEGDQAIRVAICESSDYWKSGIPQKAVNGQYLGMFQMGWRERRDYGHGPDPWTQARAAHRYFVSSGRDWSPWECKP